MDKNHNNFLIFMMAIIPVVGILLNIYALFLFIPIGFLFKESK